MRISENSEINSVLFDLLKQGDENAFEKIYKLYWAQLYNEAYKRLPEKEICQDIVQNIFADLWNRRTMVDLNNPVAYLHTAVRFQVLKHFNKNSKQQPFLLSFEQNLISPLQTDANLLENDAKVLIQLFIKALPRKRREIFLLHYFEGLTTAKIAVKLNVSQKTVQNQLTTASHALRFKLTHLWIFVLAILTTFLKG